MEYFGDISREDAGVLAKLACVSQNRRILEFGSGASTQVLAQSAPRLAQIISIETDPYWIARTEENLAKLRVTRPVWFRPFEDVMELQEEDPTPFDLIFVDGIDRLRPDFAMKTWPLLRIGGAMLFHDTRRPEDLKVALGIPVAFLGEVEAMLINCSQSNITVLIKREPLLYVNWNAVEGREPM